MIPEGLKLGHAIAPVEALPDFRVRLTYIDGFVGELEGLRHVIVADAHLPR